MYIGGFIGEASGYGTLITDCFATGNVSVYGQGPQNVGGLIGYTSGPNNISSIVEISKCYASGNVSAINDTTAENSHMNVGALVGNQSRNTAVSECYASGSVSLQKLNENTGNLSAGGLVGSMFTDAPQYNLSNTLSNCYATGNVYIDNAATSDSAAIYIGGLSGQAADANTSIIYSYSTGSIAANNNGSGAIYAGGITGLNAGTVKYTAAFGSVMTAGAGTNQQGRIYGDSTETSVKNNNYALATTRLGTGGYVSGASSYINNAITVNGAPNLADAILNAVNMVRSSVAADASTSTGGASFGYASSDVNTAANMSNGADVTTLNNTFWTDTLGFNGDDSVVATEVGKSDQPGYIAPHTPWTIPSGGNPKLGSVGGQ
jgi:hypothetical protein